MEIKVLNKTYHEQLKNLVTIVSNNLVNPEWLIVMTNEEVENISTVEDAVNFIKENADVD